MDKREKKRLMTDVAEGKLTMKEAESLIGKKPKTQKKEKIKLGRKK